MAAVMLPAYAHAVAMQTPNAELVHDKFHVAKQANGTFAGGGCRGCRRGRPVAGFCPHTPERRTANGTLLVAWRSLCRSS